MYRKSCALQVVEHFIAPLNSNCLVLYAASALCFKRAIAKELINEWQSRTNNGRCFSGDGTCRDVASTGESMSAVQARQEEARRKRRRKRRSGSSVVSSCFQGKSSAQIGAEHERGLVAREHWWRENVGVSAKRFARPSGSYRKMGEGEKERERDGRGRGCGSRRRTAVLDLSIRDTDYCAHAPPRATALSFSISHR